MYKTWWLSVERSSIRVIETNDLTLNFCNKILIVKNIITAPQGVKKGKEDEKENDFYSGINFC